LPLRLPQVLERFAQRQTALLLEHTDERVSLQLSWEAMPHAADFPNQRLSVRIRTTSTPPVLRSLHFTRTSGPAASHGMAWLGHCRVTWSMMITAPTTAHQQDGMCN
jgi:hypothetical protein